MQGKLKFINKKTVSISVILMALAALFYEFYGRTVDNLTDFDSLINACKIIAYTYCVYLVLAIIALVTTGLMVLVNKQKTVYYLEYLLAAAAAVIMLFVNYDVFQFFIKIANGGLFEIALSGASFPEGNALDMLDAVNFLCIGTGIYAARMLFTKEATPSNDANQTEAVNTENPMEF